MPGMCYTLCYLVTHVNVCYTLCNTSCNLAVYPVLAVRPRNDNHHRPSIHSKTAALLREQHAGGSQTARPIAVDERSSADPARSRRTTAISREPAARCGGTHGRRHAPAMGEGQGPTPWLFSSQRADS